MNLYSENNLVEIKILQYLKEVIDPEIAINIVDLGLIYKVTYSNQEKHIRIKMTLSTKGCPMGDVIQLQIQECLLNYFPGHEITIEVVWEPIWTNDFITPAGKKILGSL